MTDISLKKLLETNAHFGHQVKRWNPRISEFLYGHDQGIHIFDLTKTKDALIAALNFMLETKKAGKQILFVGTKKQVKEKIREIAESLNYPFVSERFLGGTITNFDQIKKSIRKLSDMKADMASGVYDKYTKKERLLLKREIDRLERFFGGLSEVSALPSVMFVVDTHKEIGAVKEATKMGIQIVGITDSNADPTLVDYPIPMNDDSSKALDYVLEIVQEVLSDKVVKPQTAKVTKPARAIAKKEKVVTKKVAKKESAAKKS